MVSEAFGVPVENIDPAAPWSALGDSLDIVESVMALEEAFDIELEGADVEELKCPEDLIRAIERRLGDDDPAVSVPV